VTEYDKRLKVSQIVKKTKQVKGLHLKVDDMAKKTEAAVEKENAGGQLTADEEALVAEAEYGTPYPLTTDKDTEDMRSAAIT